ncbi:hypothetical protein [Priestia endophytica]|uniref:hypothetical protein n=1 Tax=Priestia endophytica TaxID=135735 RepID=UPI000F523873|nr:hypothetical protein [Priestia endophytica]RPK04738.1 hypothetical protein FH5_01976 [Priestia endophytica]
MSWKDIKIDCIDRIEKCVGEFEVSALNFFEDLYEGDIIHYGTFKVKVYENQGTPSNNGANFNFTGYTNLKLIDQTGGFEGGIGFGSTMEQALEETIHNFIDKLKDYKESKKKGLTKENLIIVDYDEF